ncbi:MAG: sensor histidine kinase, partial [Oscillospiraceae bacterium]|nr:sensor histidine kinase [Oscillospiraceae bacterium]
LYALYPHAAAMTAVSAAVFVALLVFLACVSARRPAREEVVPNWQEKIPFDLYLLADGCLATVLIYAAVEALRSFYLLPFSEALALGAAAGVAVLFLGLWMTLCARVKLGQWWRNTVIFRLLVLCWRILKWLGRLLRAAGRGIVTLVRGIPLVWKTVLLLAAICLYELICIAGLYWNTEGLYVSWLLEKLILCAGVLFLALQLRRLQESGAALAAGDLDAKVDTRHMYWDFRRHGKNLNAISQGMGIAVEKQLKSERLKTELITNVSHDIKTPLTSIINYVDLLRRDHTPEQQEEYLSVLDRQSRKLKKLTEDLVEVSKASTGNLPVNASRRSISELLSQALGEYSEKLEGAQLEPVLSLPQHDLFACVDGTLMWRVLDNLFSNACKYAQSGTRLYIDAAERDGQVCLAFKNISRERLNIPADELLERFVRGDSARSTEGSGLGLNIARSLTELQGGTFSLSIDGDLFKVELTLPQAA